MPGREPVRSARSRLRADAREILRSALEECSPGRILASRLRWTGKSLDGPGFRFDLQGRRPLVLSYGKASVPMARALAEILRGVDLEGIVVAPARSRAQRLAEFQCLAGRHPVPDVGSFRAGRRILGRARRARQGDPILHLISGGGSSLLAAPLSPLVTDAEKVLLHRLVLASGLGIREMNLVRKRFSAIKGGRLLLSAPRARHLSLILSDVPEREPEVVAGGPTLPDRSSDEECRAILEDTGILGALPPRLRRLLDRRGLPGTPGGSEPGFRSHRWAVLASGADLVAAAAARARALGYRTRVVRPSIEEPVEEAVSRLFRESDRLRKREQGRLCVVAGGEARVAGGERKGRGGRAQEMAAAAARRMRGGSGRLFLAAGSDGVDGNSLAAGAVADGATLRRARHRGLDPEGLLRRGDTFRLFHGLSDSVITGPTGNNLRDLYLLLETPGASAARGASADRRRS